MVLLLLESTKHSQNFPVNKSLNIAAPEKQILQGKWVLKCTSFHVDDAMINGVLVPTLFLVFGFAV